MNELEKLKTIDLPKAREELKLAMEQGDGAHDNALWAIAEQKFNQILNKISLLEVATSKNEARTYLVAFPDGKDREVTITADSFIDPVRYRYSVQSKFGKLLIRSKEGDTFSIATPSGKKTYKLLKIL